MRLFYFRCLQAASGPKTTLTERSMARYLMIFPSVQAQNKKAEQIKMLICLLKIPAVVQKVVSVLIKLSVLVFAL